MQYLGIIIFITIILIYALVLVCTFFTFFKVMRNCIYFCILNVIWQLNALNGFNFNGN